MARRRGRYKSRWKLFGRVVLAAALLLAASVVGFFFSLTARSTESDEMLQNTLANFHMNFPLSGRLSLCPEDKMLRSLAVNKLGTYPQEKRFVTIGIGSISRPGEKQYLSGTIKSLIDNLDKTETNEVFIVVFLADLNDTLRSNTRTKLSNAFDKYIGQGMLHVIEVTPEFFYLPLMNVKKKYGDSDERIKWRSKQNLDYAFLMCYSKALSQYYLHLEDDVVPSPSFYSKLKEFISAQDMPWPSLDAASLGHTGKVYHSEDIGNLASFFMLMYNEMPVDWLIMFWRAVKLDFKDGGFHFEKYILPPASLFEHLGDQSSLNEKGVQVVREQYFDLYDHKYRGLNPPAVVSTSLSTHQGNPQDAYNKGSGYFWGKEPKENDYVSVIFKTALNVREVFIDTGSHFAPNDWLKSGILQASFASDTANLNLRGSCGEFKTIGEFDKGKAKIIVTEQKDVTCLQVLITKPQQEWLFLREIDIWQKSTKDS